MVIKLKRYEGDTHITKSVMEVWMDGEQEPRLTCEARETGYRTYTESFPGASRFCLPVGRWRLKAGRSPYSPMGLRVTKCPGHRQVFIGHKWARQCYEGEILIGEPVEVDMAPAGEEPRMDRQIENGEAVFRRLDKLVYAAFARGEEMWMEIGPKETSEVKSE